MTMSGDWCDRVCHLLATAAYGDAEQLVQANASRSKLVPRRFLAQLMTLVEESPDRGAVLASARAILRQVALHCPTTDLVLDLVDASTTLDPHVFQLKLFFFQLLLEREQKILYLDLFLSLIRATLKKIALSRDVELVTGANDKVFDLLQHVAKLFGSSTNVNALLSATLLHFVDLRNPDLLRSFALRALPHFVPDPFDLMEAARAHLGSPAGKGVSCHLLDREVVPSTAFALYFHHVWTSECSNAPQVYSPEHKFSSGLLLANSLLGGDGGAGAGTVQGLELLRATRLPPRSLTISYLGGEVRKALVKLNYLMVFCENKEHRVMALAAFDGLIETFDLKAQYHLLLNYRSEITHAGTLAHLISKLKIHFDASNDLPASRYFKGKQLFDLLKLYSRPNENTDLTQNAEQQLAALNFFWYLLALNKKSDLNMKGLYPQLKSDFVEPLGRVVEACLADCKQQLNELQSGAAVPELNVSVQLPLPELTQDDKVNAVLCARNAAELVQLNLHRVLEFWPDG